MHPVFGDTPLVSVPLLVPLSDHDGDHEAGATVLVPEELADAYRAAGIAE